MKKLVLALLFIMYLSSPAYTQYPYGDAEQKVEEGLKELKNNFDNLFREFDVLLKNMEGHPFNNQWIVIGGDSIFIDIPAEMFEKLRSGTPSWGDGDGDFDMFDEGEFPIQFDEKVLEEMESLIQRMEEELRSTSPSFPKKEDPKNDDAPTKKKSAKKRETYKL